MKVYQRLLRVIKEKQAGFLILLDPDRLSPIEIADLAWRAEKGGADAILVGSSLLLSTHFDEAIKNIKEKVQTPVIIFPGNAIQVSKFADAVLFLSLISGRNPNLLIGEQVKASPVIKEFGLEPLPTGYMLIESGKMTSVQFMSDTLPLPSNKPDIACAHALAAEYLGMKFIFMDAGSGAENSVPASLIKEVRKFITLPLIIGGGIRDPKTAREKVKAGANFVVIGNTLEEKGTDKILKDFAKAIHCER
ncbi:MAG: geranylgeranylglyceryl/heptaprenylglyceryl phosphate synthase [candidate division Zixibacteria bacterium]|nr:geranylgeranylglyceryl/heptaprenylglyceryl phosphate synthase [candidate division Zixibacteria bacterium]